MFTPLFAARKPFSVSAIKFRHLQYCGDTQQRFGNPGSSTRFLALRPGRLRLRRSILQRPNDSASVNNDNPPRKRRSVFLFITIQFKLNIAPKPFADARQSGVSDYPAMTWRIQFFYQRAEFADNRLSPETCCATSIEETEYAGRATADNYFKRAAGHNSTLFAHHASSATVSDLFAITTPVFTSISE